MEEQGGENCESKYRSIQYDDDMLQEPPEGFSFTYHKIQTDRGDEKFVPITIGGHPILRVKPGYRNINSDNKPKIPLDVMKYLFPDYDENNPSDPYGRISTRCPDIPKPCVFLNAAHEKRLLDLQAAAIQRKADLKRHQEKLLEAYFNRNSAANLSAPTASSSGTKADQYLGESSSTIA